MNQRVAWHTIVPEREGGATFRHSWSLFTTGLRTLLPQFWFWVNGDGDTQKRTGEEAKNTSRVTARWGMAFHLWGKR